MLGRNHTARTGGRAGEREGRGALGADLEKAAFERRPGGFCGEPGADWAGEGRHGRGACAGRRAERRRRPRQGRIRRKLDEFTGDLSAGAGTRPEGTYDLRLWGSHFHTD